MVSEVQQRVVGIAYPTSEFVVHSKGNTFLKQLAIWRSIRSKTNEVSGCLKAQRHVEVLGNR